MEITKHGKTCRNLTCPICECKFNVTESDIRKEFGHDIRFVSCPECTCLINCEENINDESKT